MGHSLFCTCTSCGGCKSSALGASPLCKTPVSCVHLTPACQSNPCFTFSTRILLLIKTCHPHFSQFWLFWRWIISWASCEWLCQLIGGGALTSGDRTLSCTSATNDQVFERKTFPGQRTEEIQLFCDFIAWAFSSFLFYFYLKIQRHVLRVLWEILKGLKGTLTKRNKSIYWCAECLK